MPRKDKPFLFFSFLFPPVSVLLSGLFVITINDFGFSSYRKRRGKENLESEDAD
jgi:hypothetical protein